MCHFITAAIPGDADLKQVRAVIAAHRRGFQRLANPNLQSQLPPGDQYLGLTRKMCDCGTVLGCLRSGAEASAHGRGRRQTPEQRLAEAQGWLDFLRALLSVGSVPHVGLLLHWYRTGPEEERFAIQRTETVRLDEATPEALMRIEEDVLYRFER